MDCADVADRSAAYLDHELSPGECQLFETHLDGCTDCRSLLERLAAQDLGPPLVVQGLEDDAMWRSMDQRLATEWDRVQADRPKSPPLMTRRLTVRLPLALAYAALLLLSLAWGWGNLQRAVRAEGSVQEMSQQLDREQRLAAEPATPAPVPRDAYSLVNYTPHRGTF